MFPNFLVAAGLILEDRKDELSIDVFAAAGTVL